MEATEILFLIIAAITVISAAIVAFSNKIIYAAFSLLLTLFGFAALYVYLSADFIAVSQVMIYVGGILILILFGVLMTQKIYNVSVKSERNPVLPTLLTAVGSAVVLGLIIFKTPWRQVADSGYAPITAKIGRAIMGDFLLPFEIASILLLAALIGSVFIARAEEKK